jgi:hypothetical protein
MTCLIHSTVGEGTTLGTIGTVGTSGTMGTSGTEGTSGTMGTRGTEGTGLTTGTSGIATTAPCYPSDIMYRDDFILSIKDVDGNRPIAVASLRSNTTGVTFSNTQQPTILVEVNYNRVDRILSISLPTANGATNANQIEVAFYGPNRKILLNELGKPWIVQTSLGVTTVRLLQWTLRPEKIILNLSSLKNSLPMNQWKLLK